MNESIVFHQPAGLGDIFFLQKAVDFFVHSGYDKIIWPIAESMMDEVTPIINPNIFWINESKFFPTKIHASFDACIADRYHPELSVMEAKYKIINQDYSDWVNYFNFARDKEKEIKLYNLLTKNLHSSKFSLVNDTYGSYPNPNKKEGLRQPKYEPIYLSKIDNYCLIDWSLIIENASEIITVDTSINYIIEKLTLKKECLDNLHLYSRFTPANFFHIKNIFNKPWTKYK